MKNEIQSPAEGALTDEQIEAAWRLGWRHCRDAETVGDESREQEWSYKGANVIEAVANIVSAEPPWPIAKLTVAEDGAVSATLYAPGLPDGEFDVWLEPLPAARSSPAGDKPCAWARQQFIHDDAGFSIGTDDPELHWGDEPPEGEADWHPLYGRPVAQSQLKAVEGDAPKAFIRHTWNRSGSKSLVFERPDELSLAEEATGVEYEPLFTRPASKVQPKGTEAEAEAERRFFAQDFYAEARGVTSPSPAVKPEVPEVPYLKLIEDAWSRHKYAQGSNGCIAFKRGAEWMREYIVAASQPPVQGSQP